MKSVLLTTAFVVFIGIAGCSLIQNQDNQIENITAQGNNYFSEHVKPIFDNKCIACHSCFNSPCQLKLSSYQGAIRGAHELSIFDIPKLESREPTRMFIDHHSEKAWRKKGFFPVLGDKDKSLMSVMVSDLDGIESGKQKIFKAEESRECMSENSPLLLDDYEELNPAGRMPYGFPGLSQEEINKIKTWQELKLPGPSLEDYEKKVRNHIAFKQQIREWEEFFNQKSMKHRLVSRYIYEHLFLAHIFFNENSQMSFRLVRSKTRKGKIEEIGTLFPFDSAGKEFYYRLRPVIETMMHKRHIPFEFNQKKLSEWKQNFIESKWDSIPKKMPAYGSSGSNPFKTFSAIPVDARYKFFLDESAYHIMTFIKGPVCRGQTAVNVINDHFWVLFLDPKKDPLVNSEELYKEVTKEMKLPAKLRDSFAPMVDFRKNYWKAVKAKFAYLNQKKLDESWIWDGEKKNSNSVITVLRHYDSAHVMKGLQGRQPKTVWVLDYHVFESIYYNLTAGYNMFGPVLHQLNSRLFMEISRIASEDLFLSFLGEKERAPLRRHWNRSTPTDKESTFKWVADLIGNDSQEEMEFEYPFYGQRIKSSMGDLSKVDKKSLLNYLKKNHYSTEQITSDRAPVPSELKKIEELPNKVIAALPDNIIFKYQDKVYTLVHHKAHLNVSMIFFEDERRARDEDTLDIMSGVTASYPNLLMDFDRVSIQNFVKALVETKDRIGVSKVLKQYSVYRDDKNFWETYKWLSKRSYDPSTKEFGYLDLNRYENLPYQEPKNDR